MTPSEDRVLNKLKPCPWCREPAEINGGPAGETHEEQPFAAAYWGACTDCGAIGPVEETEDEAIAAWNRRADPVVEELRGALSTCEWQLEMLATEWASQIPGAISIQCGLKAKRAREALALPVGGGSAGGRVQTSPDGLTDAQHSAGMEREYRTALLAAVARYGQTLTTHEILSGLEVVTREAMEEE